VLSLADDRKQESLDGFWLTLTRAKREGITAVAMDMWEPSVQSTRAHLPAADSKIVFDKFHAVKHLHDAVDQVRRQEHRTLKRSGDGGLTGTNICGLMRSAAMTSPQRGAFRALQQEDLRRYGSRARKERFRTF
jgi:transposase